MAVNFSLRVGEILECNFGNYLVSQNGQFSTKYYDGRTLPEIIRNRLVVILNGKINGNVCIVVPLSVTRDYDKLNCEMHVETASNVVNGLQFFDQQICWAETGLVQQTSRNRLSRIRTYRGYLNQRLPHELVVDAWRVVIKSINATSLMN